MKAKLIIMEKICKGLVSRRTGHTRSTVVMACPWPCAANILIYYFFVIYLFIKIKKRLCLIDYVLFFFQVVESRVFLKIIRYLDYKTSQILMAVSHKCDHLCGLLLYSYLIGYSTFSSDALVFYLWMRLLIFIIIIFKI